VNFAFIGWSFLLDHERQPDAVVSLSDFLKVVITTIFRLPPVVDCQTPPTRHASYDVTLAERMTERRAGAYRSNVTRNTLNFLSDVPDMQQTIALFDIS